MVDDKHKGELIGHTILDMSAGQKPHEQTEEQLKMVRKGVTPHHDGDGKVHP